MPTGDPLPGVKIVDVNLATMVILLGFFAIIVGIIISGVIYRESREWKKMIMPLFDRDSTEAESESPEESSWLTPERAALGKKIFGRVFTHMDIAGVLGGGATVIMGILIVLIGLALYS
jgi:hypothetical protein